MYALRVSLFFVLLLRCCSAADTRAELKFTPDCREQALPPASEGAREALVAAEDGTVWFVSISAEAGAQVRTRILQLNAVTGSWLEKSELPVFTLPEKGARVQSLRLAFGPKGRTALALVFESPTSPVQQELWLSASSEGGGRWSAPSRIRRANALSAPVLIPEEKGAWGLSWIERDGQGKSTLQQADFSEAKTSECVQGTEAALASGLSGAAFPDGSQLQVFRAGGGSEFCDPLARRKTEATWQDAFRFGRDGWKTTAELAAPIAFSAKAPKAAAAWYTEADGEPRVLLSSTPDAGLRWTAAARVDQGKALGSPAVLLLSDASCFVVWEEGRGPNPELHPGFYIRRYSSGGGSLSPFRLPAVATGSQPQLLALENTPDARRQLLVAFGDQQGKLQRPAYRLVLPSDSELRKLDDSCNCSAGSQPGYAFRGSILAIKGATLRLRHDAIPGLMRAGELEAKVDAASLGYLREGRRLMARLVPGAEGWTLVEIRVLGE